MTVRDLCVTAIMLLGSCVVIAAPALDSTASDAVNQRNPGARDQDRQDVWYLGDRRPILIQFGILADDEPLPHVWSAYVDKLFDDCDLNHDQLLTGEELSRVPPVDHFRAPPAGTGDIQRPHLRSRARLTCAGLAEYLRRIGGGPFTVQFDGQPQDRLGVQANRQPSASNAVLFDRLDRDQNRGLSRKEFEDGANRLQTLDLNDDEIISANELRQVERPGAMQASEERSGGLSPFASRAPEESPLELVQRLLEHYDKYEGHSSEKMAKDQRLSRTEAGISAEEFQEYDADSNAELDFDEIAQWVRTAQPALVVRVRLGQRQPDVPFAEVLHNDAALGIQVRTFPNSVTLSLAGTQIEIDSDITAALFSGSKETYRQQFALADANNNGYLEPEEVMRQIVFPVNFAELDTDGDGKVFERELILVMQQRDASARGRASLNVTDQGHNLFEILDINRDRRLARRELRAALDRMEAWDADGNGELTESEISRHFRMTFGRLQPRSVRRPGMIVPAYADPAGGSPETGAGPVWFRKMDRNRDGELSPREFLGSAKDFERVDANHDGLIDASEASKAN